MLRFAQHDRSALKKLLEASARGHEPVEFICVVGSHPLDWDYTDGRKNSREMLASFDARIVMYDELIQDAYAAYQEYLEQDEETGRIARLIESIETPWLDGPDGAEEVREIRSPGEVVMPLVPAESPQTQYTDGPIL